MSGFHIYVPENLSFADYITIIQTARVLADGYDKKVSISQLREYYTKPLHVVEALSNYSRTAHAS
jgi:hypothetical protein